MFTEIDHDHILALSNEARDCAESSSERIPSARDWGLYAYGDASPAIGGGSGSFLWFATRAEMFDFVGRLLTFVWPGPVSADHGAVAAKVKAIAARARLSGETDDATRETLNATLRHFAQIPWWGSYDDLCRGDAPFAREIRAECRGGDPDDDEAERPIEAEEREEFLDFMSTYGI